MALFEPPGSGQMIPITRSSPFATACKLTGELFRVIQDKGPDHPASDAVRDMMDMAWKKLTDEDRQLVRNLSEDLDEAVEAAIKGTIGLYLRNRGDS